MGLITSNNQIEIRTHAFYEYLENKDYFDLNYSYFKKKLVEYEAMSMKEIFFR